MPLDAASLEAVAEVVRRHYGFEVTSRPEAMPRAHQRRHRKMLVRTTGGLFVAKTYQRDPIVLDALRFQHRLSDHLHKHRLPVARIQRTPEGKGIVEEGDWAMELQHYVDAAPMEVRAPTLEVAGKTLGRFHKVCRGFPTPPRDARKWRFSEAPRQPFQRLYERAVEERADSAAAEECNSVVRFLHHARDALSEARRETFETGLIHGDWHGGNLLFRGDELKAIVDLEFAGDGCYLEDISYAVSNLCIRTTSSPEKMALRLNLVLDQYQLVRDLSFYEKIALYYAVGVKHVTTVSYQINQDERRTLAGLTPGQWLPRLAQQCAWLQAQADKIRFGGA